MRKMGSVPIFLVLLLAVLVAVPGAIYFLQDRLLFYPQPLSEAERSAIRQQFPQVREVFLGSENHKLHAWHVPAAPGRPLILYFGGNAENVAWMIPEALARTPGIGWLLVDYRGYGGSEGAPSASTIGADALLWHDHALKEFKPSQVFAFGRSLGTGAAVRLASERPLAGVVLVTPFDKLSAVAKRHYPFLPVELMLRHRFDSVDLAPKIVTPLLTLAAERDQVIPPEHARRLHEAWAGPKDWVELAGAGHNDTDVNPAFWRSVVQFLGNPGM